LQPEPDEYLFERIRSGDREAIAQLYRRYKEGLYSYCYRLLKDTAQAEDAVHDTFIHVCNSVYYVKEPLALRSWLFRVARNEALMKLRGRRESTDGGMEELWDDNTPLTLLEEKDTAGIVGRCVEMLRIEYREVLVLREFEQMSYAEIAGIAGTTESSVKSRLFKARKALAGKLEPWFRERAPQ
jgi:RNA polymerase sigma-70 factor (ECF subfamily)